MFVYVRFIITRLYIKGEEVKKLKNNQSKNSKI